jgi:Flavoprotein
VAGDGSRILLVGGAGIGVALLPAWIGWATRQWRVEFRVVLSAKAVRLVSARALAVLTGGPVYSEVMRDGPPERVIHMDLAIWPDAILVAPATADILARAAHGMADDLVTAVLLSTPRPVVMVPSVPAAALTKPSVRRNLATLEADGFGMVPMASGLQVSDGADTPGGMADAPTAFGFLWEFMRRRTVPRNERGSSASRHARPAGAVERDGIEPA